MINSNNDNNDYTPNDIEILLNNHKSFFQSQKTLDIDYRIKNLKKLKEAIKHYQNDIYEALFDDLGKNEFESYATEVGFVLSSIDYAVKNIKKWSKQKKVITPIHLLPAKSYIVNEPYGTVLIMGPFNYPFQLIIEPLIGVIASGNCAVIKPSEISPNVSKIIYKIITSTFNKEYISCVEGGIKTNTSLINSKFDYIFFTGSVSVGKIVMEAAAKNLVPVTLELGGKSPVIVDKSANIKVAAQRIMWGKTLNAGQTCVAPDYLIVHEEIKDILIKEMKRSLEYFYGEEAINSKDFGRIINKRHFDRLKNIIEESKDSIIYGGHYDKNIKYISPTFIDVKSYDEASMKEEIFGPILPIITYTNLDNAISLINSKEKPLAMYLFTEDKNVEEKVLRTVSSGGACVNDVITHIINPELPFGGIGNSGIGSYHGAYSFETFSHKKSIIKKTSKINVTLAFPPYNNKKLKVIKRFLK